MKGFRKYSLALLALVCAFVLALLGKLSSDFASIAAIVVGSFNLAHGAADVAGAMNWKPDK